MFCKPYTIKPYANVKSSEQRSIFQKLQSQFSITDDQKALILPKQIQTAKLITSTNAKLQVYSLNLVPYFLLIDGVYLPTTALLEQLPLELQLNLCPVVYTVPNTIQFLKSGADFMLPGLAEPLPSKDLKLPSGTPVQIRDVSTNNLMATGLTLVDFAKVNIGDKGKGVRNINTVGDRLTPESTGVVNVDTSLQDLSINETTSQAPESSAENDEDTKYQESTTVNEDLDDTLSQEEADEAFFYAVMKTTREPHEYPMKMATFATLLQSNMPYDHPELNIKATSFKKMTKLMKYYEKKGRFVLKERNGDLQIVSVNVPKDEQIQVVEKPKVKSKSQKSNKITVVAYFKPTPAFRKILGPQFQDNDAYEGKVIKQQLKKYIDAYAAELKDGNGNIILNEALRSGLGQKKTVESIPEADIGDIALKKCSQFFKLVPNNVDPTTLPLESGVIPKIEISTSKRLYGKLMTLIQVSEIKKFHLNPQTICEELRHLCAGSATIQPVKGIEYIAVQGPHVDKVRNYLEGKGIGPKHIAVVK